jgi:hypothetical protein
MYASHPVRRQSSSGRPCRAQNPHYQSLTQYPPARAPYPAASGNGLPALPSDGRRGRPGTRPRRTPAR